MAQLIRALDNLFTILMAFGTTTETNSYNLSLIFMYNLARILRFSSDNGL